METPVPYMKCFHVNELCCSQYIQTVEWKNSVGFPFKIIYMFTGNCGKMLFQVTKNGRVVIVCLHCCLGPQLPESVTIFSAVAQCSLVERHSTVTYEVTAFIFFPDGRKGSCEILILFYQTARRHIQDDRMLWEYHISWDAGSSPPWKMKCNTCRCMS